MKAYSRGAHDGEMQLLRQENEILRLRVRVAQAEKRCADLQRMHDNAQRHIGRLQRQIDASASPAAEMVFREAAK